MTFRETASSWRIRRCGRGELDRLIGAQAVDLAAIDLLLLEPAIDRRFAHSERRRELFDARSGASELDDLTTDLWRVPAGQLSSGLPGEL